MIAIDAFYYQASINHVKSSEESAMKKIWFYININTKGDKMNKILRLMFSTFLTILSSGVFASEQNIVQCRVERVAGLFYSFMQPQVGDTFQININSLDTTVLKVGSALISLPEALKSVSIESRILLFAEQSFGDTSYAFQLIIFGELSSMRSVISHQGDGSSSVATAELSCSTIE